LIDWLIDWLIDYLIDLAIMLVGWSLLADAAVEWYTEYAL
jgi:hypothetical protein